MVVLAPPAFAIPVLAAPCGSVTTAAAASLCSGPRPSEERLASPRSDEYFRERQPTDPFFYPTTVNPLTTLGLDAIEQSMPRGRPGCGSPGPSVGSGRRIRPGSSSSLALSPSQDGSFFEPLFSSPPMSSFVDNTEDLTFLQKQNDSLARQVQALEHAKSLAAVQSAQALQKIRARQEQMRLQAQQACQQAKEIQAELPSTSAVAPLPSNGFCDAAPHTERSRPCSAPVRDSFAEQRRAGNAVADEILEPQFEPGGLPEKPHWNQDIWRPLPPGSTILEQNTGDSTHLAEALQMAFDTPTIVAAACALGPAGGRRTDRQGADVLSAELPGPPVPLPAVGVPSTEISTMASRILTAHNAAGSESCGANMQSLVDALGNPLGPISGRELPDIKSEEDTYERVFPSSKGVRVRSPACAGQPCHILQASDGSGTTNGADGDNCAAGAQLKITACAQERVAPVSARGTLPHSLSDGQHMASNGRQCSSTSHQGENQQQPQLPQASLQLSSASSSRQVSRTNTDRQTSAVSRSASRGAGGGTASDAVQPAAAPAVQPIVGGAADAAAGSARVPAVPPPTTPQRRQNDTSAATTVAIATATEGSAASRTSRERPNSRSPSPQSHSQQAEQLSRSSSSVATPSAPVPQQLEQSEQLRAELEECLDTIKWCAGSVTRESLQSLANTSKPPTVVKDVLETVALLIGQPETRWDRLKRLISGPAFSDRIHRLNLQQGVSREQFRKLRERLQHPDFDEELIKTVCVPVVPLAMWCRAIGVYLSRTRFKGGPGIKPVAAARASTPPHHPRPERAAAPAAVAEAPGEYMVFDPDIERMDAEQVRAVKDLTISRPSVGQITFHGETDCTDLDFERIVRLEVGEVLVYPDSSTKPPVGVGLNKAATVTMFQCWPPQGSKLLGDAKSQERYRKKIKQMTEEKHAQFIDYDCTTGVWQFSVDHF